ncbi:MAG TPA: hypothetical protein VIK30_03680 [Polyangia bacterium]
MVRPLDVAALKRSGPRAVAVAVSEVPDLYTESAGIPLLPVGPLAMAVAGTASVRHASAKADTLRAMGVEDPAVMVRGLVVAALVQRLGLPESDTRSFVTAAPTPEAMVSEHRGVDLIIDVRTARWGLRSTREYNSLYLDYVGTLRLIDGRSGAVLAEGSCSTPGPGSDDQFPVLAPENLADGWLLKQELWVAANRCANHYLARVLRLSPES